MKFFPKVMGILNITPDSFSDGGAYMALDKAIDRAYEMVKEGADAIDIGGESTRPGAEELSVSVELARVIPVVEALRARFEVILSVDTSKAEVMRASIEAGADLINDVYALRREGTLEAVADSSVAVVLMHRGKAPGAAFEEDPRHWRSRLFEFFEERLEVCEAAGIDRERCILDPGFGFEKTLEENYEILAQLAHLQSFDLPLLVGCSRKSMLYKPLATSPQDCLGGSLATVGWAAWVGAGWVRVHDVKETSQFLRVYQKLLGAAV